MEKLTIRDVKLEGKRCLMRVDFNVPLDKQTHEVTDDNRIRGALPTIQYAIDNGAKVILMSHLGRPKGERKPEFSLKPVADRLSELLGQEVFFVKNLIGENVTQAVNDLQNRQVLLLENTRFEKGEKKNDPELSKQLAELGDVHVNDAFGTAHRAHASNVGVADYLISVSGFLLEKEIEFLGNVVENPEKPYVAILGGAKVSDKIGVIENLITKADKLIIGGAMMFTFWKAKGYETGNSLVEEDKVNLAKELMERAEKQGIELILPEDALIAEKMEKGVQTKTITAQEGVPQGMMGLDIGEASIKLFKEALKDAKTVIWNGPMGVFEIEDFAKGTESIAKALTEMKDAKTVIGGGDSAAAIAKFGLKDKVTHVSTGGGASLEMLEGKELPGVSSLADQKKRQVVVAGNWKMNKTPSESMAFVRTLLNHITPKTDQVEIIVCPTYVALSDVQNVLTGTTIEVGAQNIYPKVNGAFTGEISPIMLNDLKVKYAIIGHSERRAIFKESNKLINEKVRFSLEHQLIPIFCLGEVLEERESGKTFEVLEKQLKEGLKDIGPDEMKKTIVAYEPVWAIGTGKVASNEQAQEAIHFIREELAKMYDATVANEVRILYGGSIKPENFTGILAQEDIDGGLVGGASLKESFVELVEIAQQMTK
ncbi:MAG: triose-phosphate isomerase [Thermotogota bacterium]|nr:triose-phosphate isomerase [Thermotogota bacterium]